MEADISENTAVFAKNGNEQKGRRIFFAVICMERRACALLRPLKKYGASVFVQCRYFVAGGM